MSIRQVVKGIVLLVLAVALIVALSGLNGSNLAGLLTTPGSGARVLLAVVLVLAGRSGLEVAVRRRAPMT